jgi:hypothetical protein
MSLKPTASLLTSLNSTTRTSRGFDTALPAEATELPFSPTTSWPAHRLPIYIGRPSLHCCPRAGRGLHRCPAATSSGPYLTAARKGPQSSPVYRAQQYGTLRAASLVSSAVQPTRTHQTLYRNLVGAHTNYSDHTAPHKIIKITTQNVHQTDLT